MPEQPSPRFRLQRSVGFKFGLILSAASTAIVAVAVVLIMQSFQVQDGLQAERTARASAERFASAVQRVFEDAFAIVENTQDDLTTMKNVGVQDPLVYDTLLQRMLDGGDRYGAWLEWDGKDAPTGPAFAARLDAQGPRRRLPAPERHGDAARHHSGRGVRERSLPRASR